MKKNDVFTAEITDMTLEGSGVTHIDGIAVFVPNTAIGDVVEIKIVKALKSYSYGIVMNIIKPSVYRINSNCKISDKCGGCTYRHISYEAELALKKNIVEQTFARIGNINVPCDDIIGSSREDYYRNKAQYPFGEQGCGFYAKRSHRIIECDECKLQPNIFDKIKEYIKQYAKKEKISPYNELDGTGILRHIFLRIAESTGDIMLVLVATKNDKRFKSMIEPLIAEFDSIKTVVVNINDKNTNVILGNKCITLYGEGYIIDTLCGIQIKISPLSFYQVNKLQAEVLYQKAIELANLTKDETLLDLYCGTGTIGLIASKYVKEVIGVEIIPQAIQDAKDNAIRNNIENAEFICADVGDMNLTADVVIVDPPRKGLATNVIDDIGTPNRIVMVSCNPSTAARDAALFEKRGYKVDKIVPVDMFPRTGHVETVCLLSKLNVDHHIEVNLNMDELDLTSAESKATYDKIKTFVLENSGLKVTNLYIAQVKEKMGIKERENFNVSKKEDAKVPQCPIEKEKAIVDALKHFGMIE